MRQIDLSCKIVAPALAGFFLSWWTNHHHPSTTTTTTTPTTTMSPSSPQQHADLRGAAVLVGALNVAALIIEYLCTKQIYHLIPDLAIKDVIGGEKSDDGDDILGRNTSTLNEEEGEEAAIEMDLLKPNTCLDKNRGVRPRDDQVAERKASNNNMIRCNILPNGLRIYLQQPTALGGIGLALL
jgi:hypothetical protein